MELSAKLTEVECVTMKLLQNIKSRRLLPPLSRSPSLSEGGFRGGQCPLPISCGKLPHPISGGDSKMPSLTPQQAVPAPGLGFRQQYAELHTPTVGGDVLDAPICGSFANLYLLFRSGGYHPPATNAHEKTFVRMHPRKLRLCLTLHKVGSRGGSKPPPYGHGYCLCV